jgi:hypothetical protein
MSLVRYELGFYTPEDGILHSHCRDKLECLNRLSGGGYTVLGQDQRTFTGANFVLLFTTVKNKGGHKLRCSRNSAYLAEWEETLGT